MGKKVESEAEGQATARRRKALAWWELWGLGGAHKPAQSKARKAAPPSWYLPLFAGAAGLSVSVAALMGWGPPPLPQLALAAVKAAATAVSSSSAAEKQQGEGDVAIE